MVAYSRDNASICQDLGADRVIFQTLDDLTEACADIVKAKGLSEPQAFEVGVFCGQYVTPIPGGYLHRLEEIRGKSRPLKAVKAEREAIT
jgi:amidophosphoribosyltransferase